MPTLAQQRRDDAGRSVVSGVSRWLPLSIGAGVFAFLALNTAVQERQIVYAAIALASYLAALLSVMPGKQAGLGRFSLGSWLLLFAIVAYGVATATLAQPQLNDAARVDKSLVPHVLFWLGLGFTIFVFSYRFGPHRPLSKGLTAALNTLPSGSVRTGKWIFAVYLLGLTATVAKVALEGGYGYIGGRDLNSTSTVAFYSQPLTIVTFLRTAALYGISVRAFSAQIPSPRITVGALALTEVVIGLLSAVKESVVIAGLAILIPYVLAGGKRIPWTALAISSGLFVLFVTPFVTDFRDAVRQDGERLDAGTSISIGIESLGSGINSPQTPLDNLGQVARRVRLIDNYVVIADLTPRPYAYRPSTDILSAPMTGVIPRAIWPDKPLRLSGQDFYKIYYEGEGVSSSAITFQGSLYMHGGIVPALLGMLIFGTVLRAIDHSAETVGPQRGGLVALILFVPIVKQEMDIVTLCASLPVFAATYLVACTALFNREELTQ